MPIFEYRCGDCERQFEALVSAGRSVECPACRGANLTKLLSSPGMVGGSNGSRTATAPAFQGCGAGGPGCACRTSME